MSVHAISSWWWRGQAQAGGYTILADSDDGMEARENSTYYDTVTRVGDNSGQENIAAWHFRDLVIPFGAHIDSATLMVYATPLRAGTGVITMRAQAIDDAVVPATANRPHTWTNTTASTALAAIPLDPAPTPETVVVSIPLSSDAHDMSEVVAFAATFNSSTHAGDSGGYEYCCAWHFPTVNVPFGASIGTTTLDVTAEFSIIGSDSMTVRAQSIDDANVPGDSNLPSSWTTTTASKVIDQIGSELLLYTSVAADNQDGVEIFDEVAGLPVSWSDTETKVGDVASNEGIAAWHFATLNVPFGATIETATFAAHKSSATTGTGDLTWRAQDVDDAALPSASNYPHSWTTTTASTVVDGNTV